LGWLLMISIFEAVLSWDDSVGLLSMVVIVLMVTILGFSSLSIAAPSSL